MESLPILLILYAGLSHAMEADHVLAVSNIVTQRDRIWPAVKDGMYWGLGHTSTIVLIGMVMIGIKVHIPAPVFSYFEAAVGVMLVLIAVYRMKKFFRSKTVITHAHPHVHGGTNHHVHVHVPLEAAANKNLHKAAYGVGIVHGLAGSGALVLLVTAQIKSPLSSLLYLLLFGLGSVLGMLLIAGLFSVPFSKKVLQSVRIKSALILFSSGLCLLYGLFVIYHNLFT